MYISKVIKQCINYEYKSISRLLLDWVKNTHWRRFKAEYIVYILYNGIMKHDTLFKQKATNILEGTLLS